MLDWQLIMITPSQNWRLQKLMRVRKCSWSDMSGRLVGLQFTIKLKDNLTQTSVTDQARGRTLYFEITYSLSWLTIISDQVRLAGRVKGQLPWFELQLKMYFSMLKGAENKIIGICFRAICLMESQRIEVNRKSSHTKASTIHTDISSNISQCKFSAYMSTTPLLNKHWDYVLCITKPNKGKEMNPGLSPCVKMSMTSSC